MVESYLCEVKKSLLDKPPTRKHQLVGLLRDLPIHSLDIRPLDRLPQALFPEAWISHTRYNHVRRSSFVHNAKRPTSSLHLNHWPLDAHMSILTVGYGGPGNHTSS